MYTMNLKRLFLFLPILMSIILFYQCSDDKQPFIPKVPGQNIEDNTIQMTFVASNENPVLELNLTNETKSNIEIDWGDEFNPSYEYKSIEKGSVRHDYGSNVKEHVVTIKCPDLISISMAKESFSQIKSIYFGDLPKFKSYSFDFSPPNILEALDMTRCSRFWGGHAELYVFKENFDFSGLKKLGSLEITAYSSVKVDLSSSDLENITLKAINDSKIHLFDISGGKKIKNVNLGWFVDGKNPDTMFGYIHQINVENSSLENLNVTRFRVNNKLDLENCMNLKELVFEDVFINNEFKLAANLKRFKFSNINQESNWNRNYHNITNLDLSDLDKLESVMIENIVNLEEVKLPRKCDNLYMIWLQLNHKLTELDVSNYPNLTELYSFGQKGISKVKIYNLPKLRYFTVRGSKELSTIDMIGQFPFYQLGLYDNNLSEESLKNIVSNLKDESLPDDNKNSITIYGNPGDTEEVRSLISRLANWEIKPNIFGRKANDKQLSNYHMDISKDCIQGFCRTEYDN